MTVPPPKTPRAPLDGVELVPKYFDTGLIVTPPDNPAYTPAMLADLLESFREHHQLVPGWVCPSPDLPDDQRLCIEGNRRLAVARLLGKPFWAFDQGRFVPEAERIMLTFHHNHSRRVMSREEMAERAARYIELTECSAADAAKLLNVSPPTLSRAFGDRRIPATLKPRAAQLGLSIRSLVAAAPESLMEPVLSYAETPDETGKKPTRDQVAAFIRHKKRSGRSKAGKRKVIPLKHEGRSVSIAIKDDDTATSLAEVLKSIGAKLGKHPDVEIDGLPFLFR